MSNGRIGWRKTALVLAVGMSILGATAHAVPAAPWTVVARHLDNPHGIAFTSDGSLIVTESGHSGHVCLFDGQFCFGLNSKISSVDVATSERTTLAGGLISALFPFEAFGLGGVSVQGDRILAVTALNPQGWGNPAHVCAGLATTCVESVRTAKQQSGLLIDVDPQGGGVTTVAKVGAYDYNWVVSENASPGNPEFQPGDANPFGVLALPEGTYVADGGANTLSFVDPAGAVSVLAYIPDPPNHEPLYDAVATCVAKVGSAIYVGTLTGSLFKWENGTLSQIATGGKLRWIVSCTSDAAGNLYLVNLTRSFREFNPRPNTGSIVKIAPDLTSSYVVAPDEGLNYPNGIAFGPDGALYVVINSVCPANPQRAYAVGIPELYCPRGGQVVRLDG